MTISKHNDMTHVSCLACLAVMSLHLSVLSADRISCCHAPDNYAAVFPQPLPALFIIRQHLFHHLPEFWRVVHLFSVAQFVYNNVILHFPGRKHQQAVEVQVSL